MRRMLPLRPATTALSSLYPWIRQPMRSWRLSMGAPRIQPSGLLYHSNLAAGVQNFLKEWITRRMEGDAVRTPLSFAGRIPGNMGRCLSGRRGWFWKPVGFVLAVSATAGSLPLMGAAASIQEGTPGLAIFLIISGLAVMLGPAVLMAAIVNSVRPWVDPNSGPNAPGQPDGGTEEPSRTGPA